MLARTRTAHSAVAVGLGVGLAVAMGVGLSVALGVGLGLALVVQAARRSATARRRIKAAIALLRSSVCAAIRDLLAGKVEGTLSRA
jgi:hypothetical protein